ncbi:MAG: 4-alpha-glucanotransferase [Rhodocyclaceae bacterium]|nr:4-alpha-glucanotransferase [Rhodocyclaceae bacterium]
MQIERASGILLHPTSLPGPHGCGDFGPAARHFVDWLAAAGQSLWQVLPLGGVGPGNSPYMSSSAFAGNVLFIDLADLADQGWLTQDDLLPDPSFSAARVDYGATRRYRLERLARAAKRFFDQATPGQRHAFHSFCAEQHDWLDDYALFMALDAAHPGCVWQDWERPLVQREPAALATAVLHHDAEMAFWRFCQWNFARQWHALRSYANARGVRLVGDLPIFIAGHSAEVWANQHLFELDGGGRPSVVAGVPPDYFSATGQRWGNPLYRWNAHAAGGYAWWIARMRHSMQLYDLVRVDHFRGFEAYWEIPAAETTAIHGRWVPGPASALFDALHNALGGLPIIAEDLGIITEQVLALRKRHGLPGMLILQFAFGGKADNPYLPHNHAADAVVYTGTHDNDTTLGWWAGAGAGEREHAQRYLGFEGEHELEWQFLRAAAASVAKYAIHPMQDVLGLDGSHRMNLPGKSEGHWEWRFSWDQVAPSHGARLQHLTELYGRLPGQAG